jgi:hypothetical protein
MGPGDTVAEPTAVGDVFGLGELDALGGDPHANIRKAVVTRAVRRRIPRLTLTEG